VIWVEILSHHRNVAARHRVAGPEVRIGRGYDNDVILDDPYVAVEHVRVFRDDRDRLVAEDIGSANGMFLERDKDRQARIVIDGERPIRIGHTFLRIRETNHAVPRERAGRLEGRAGPVALGAALGTAILGIQALSVWFAEIDEPRVSHYVQSLLAIATLVVAWVALWAILSRIFSGQARLERNLLIALAGLLVFLLYGEFAEFASFALTWRALVSYDYVVMWSIVAATSFFHLRTIGPAGLKLKGGVLAGLLGLVIATQTLAQSELRAEFGQQSYLRRLLPPALRLTPAQDENAFFAEIEQLKTKLDRDRTDDPSEDSSR
jgi:Inner membrane component of T3SS, cytoplasmic domain